MYWIFQVQAKKKNELQQRVESEGLHRRTCSWKEMDAAGVVPDFPRLSEDDLRNITVGVYQLKLAKCYTHEHLNEEGGYVIKLNSDFEDILRVQVQSRHTSSRKYLIWIQYDEIQVKAWYCQCKSGARVVGTCAHVASVLWYLGFARHTEKPNGVKDWSDFVEDAAKMPALIDDSDSEDEIPEE